MLDPSPSGAGNTPPPQRFSPNEILVIEDDPGHCDIVRETLEEEGYSVQTAGHGAEALARLRSGPPPDLILLDLLMPVMDGWAFMAELKAPPELSAIPVVATTAGGLDVLFSAPVCSGYLTKPLERVHMLETIERSLSRAQARRTPPRPPR